MNEKDVDSHPTFKAPSYMGTFYSVSEACIGFFVGYGQAVGVSNGLTDALLLALPFYTLISRRENMQLVKEELKENLESLSKDPISKNHEATQLLEYTLNSHLTDRNISRLSVSSFRNSNLEILSGYVAGWVIGLGANFVYQ